MTGFYSQIPKISVYRNRIADRLSNRIFVYLKIMLAAFRFIRANDFQALPLYYDLRFYCVVFFLPE